MAVVQALGIVEQTNALLNSRDTMPIKPTTNQVLCPQNTTGADCICP